MLDDSGSGQASSIQQVVLANSVVVGRIMKAAASSGGRPGRRCDQLVLTILYVPFLCPMSKAMPS